MKDIQIENTLAEGNREIGLQGGLVMAKRGRLELGDNVYSQNRSIFNSDTVGWVIYP